MSGNIIQDAGNKTLEELSAVTPIGPPPPGITSNFVNPTSRSPAVLIVTGITMPLMLIFLSLRIYIRARVNREFTIDDHLCVVSTFLSIAYTGLTLAMLDIPGNGPVGPHIWDVPIIRITPSYFKENFACPSLFAIASITVKTSLLSFFIRLFKPFAAARIMSWIGIVAVVGFYASYIVPLWVMCKPSLALEERCTKFTSSISNAHGIFSTISDFYILFIPIHMLKYVHLSPRRKYSVGGVFLTGLGACVVSIAGTVYRFQMASSPDLTWASVPVYATVIAELNIGIICACMPIVFVLFRRGTRNVKNHLSTRFKRRAGTEPRQSGGDNINLTDRNSPTRPRAAITAVRTVVHQVHYRKLPQRDGWANTFGSFASDEHDEAAQMDGFRPYDVSISAGNDV